MSATRAQPSIRIGRTLGVVQRRARGVFLGEGRVSKLLTMKEAAAQLRMSRRTLERHIEAGLLVKYKLGGKCLIDQLDLEKFVKRNRAS